MKPSRKLFAEWFWVDRWMGSSAFLLSLELRGFYREMLSQAWLRGAALPNDHEAIRRVIGCTEAEWRRCWPKVSRYWRVEGATLVNDTQLVVYREALAAQERASDRARSAAEARWSKRHPQGIPKQSPGNAQASAQAEARAALEQCPLSLDPERSKEQERSRRARGRVFDGVRLRVSQRQHLVVVAELGAAAGDLDFGVLYREWDADLVSSGETFDTLVYIKQRAGEAARAAHSSSTRPAKNDRGEDWFEECQRVHELACNGRYAHAIQIDIDRMRAERGLSVVRSA